VSGGFVGGSDSIALNLTLGNDTTVVLYGDGAAFTGASFQGGNDTIEARR
jgi:hypothetical protein